MTRYSKINFKKSIKLKDRMEKKIIYQRGRNLD
jgi:hypothetical protein